MKIEDGRKARRILCEKHNLKCITTKCPFSKMGCYEFQTFDRFYYESYNSRRKIARIVNEVLKSEANNQG